MGHRTGFFIPTHHGRHRGGRLTVEIRVGVIPMVPRWVAREFAFGARR